MYDRPHFPGPITLPKVSGHALSVRAYPVCVFHSSSICFAYYVRCYSCSFVSPALDVFCGLSWAINSLGFVLEGLGNTVAENNSRDLHQMNKSSSLLMMDHTERPKS